MTKKASVERRAARDWRGDMGEAGAGVRGEVQCPGPPTTACVLRYLWVCGWMAIRKRWCARRQRLQRGSQDQSQDSREREAFAVRGDKPRRRLTIEGSRLKFTNLKKVFYPADGYTKRDVINFYAAVSDLLVPHLKAVRFR